MSKLHNSLVDILVKIGLDEQSGLVAVPFQITKARRCLVRFNFKANFVGPLIRTGPSNETLEFFTPKVKHSTVPVLVAFKF